MEFCATEQEPKMDCVCPRRTNCPSLISTESLDGSHYTCTLTVEQGEFISKTLKRHLFIRVASLLSKGLELSHQLGGVGWNAHPVSDNEKCPRYKTC